jgi:hypothetical protein
MNVIIYTNNNGRVNFLIPTGLVPIEVAQATDVPEGIQSFIVSKDSLPEQDMDFFDAWEQSQGVVSVNLDIAKAITKKRLRFERELLLAAQDVAFQRALETGADTTAIVAEKQRLRDITLLPDACTTLNELRALKAAA